MSDHACRTHRSSGDWKDERLTDVSRAEAFRTTAVRSSVVNSWRSAEAMNEKLPSMNASSPVGPTESGLAALAPGRVKSPRQRNREPGHAFRRPTQRSSVPPTSPVLHAPRRPRGASLTRGVGDAGVLFPARLCAADAPAPDEPSQTRGRWAGGGSAHSVSDHGTGLRGPLVLC